MKIRTAALIVIIIVLGLLSACGDTRSPNQQDLVTLTLWHNYGGQMKETMDSMVDEFNETLGLEKGIIINVTSISSSEALHQKLTMIANGDAGAPEMPDISTANPKTAILLAEKGLLLDLKEQFTQKELKAYIPRFIEEGMLGTDQLYIFPTAKSTEVLFLNKTSFDRFAAETGATYEQLRTFEGIAETAEQYYNWTDSKTPDIPNDGKTFYHADSLFNLTMIGCRQLKTDFISNGRVDYETPAFQSVWHFFFDSAVRGYFAVYDGYASDLIKTGEILCSTGSTAGVIFFDPLVTFPDNTTETAELMILPYPTFQGGQKIAMQRGSGMVVVNSTEEKNEAAGIFLKWFTSPENNLKFVASTGYLPVSKAAYGNAMTKEVEKTDNKNLQELMITIKEMQASYDYYIPPVFEDLDNFQKEYVQKLKTSVTLGREEFKTIHPLGDKTDKSSFDRISEAYLADFQDSNE